MRAKIHAFLTTYKGSFGRMLTDLYRKAITSDFVRKVIETLATRILQICISLITTVLVARILKPEGRGLYIIATTISAIGVQFCNLGLPASNTYYVAKNHKILPELFANALAVSFVFGGLGSLLAWVFFTIRPELAPVHGLLLILAFSCIPFGLANLLLQNLLLGIYAVRSYNIIELTTTIISVLLVILLILLNAVSPEAVFSMTLITSVIIFGWMCCHLMTYIQGLPKPSLRLLMNNIGYGFKVYLSTLFAFLIMRIDLLMINSMLDETQAGYYSVAVTLINMLLVFPTVVGTILFPKLSSEADSRKRWCLAIKTAYGVGAFMGIACLFALFFGKYAITVLFGKAYEPAYIPFLIMSLGALVVSVESNFRRFINTDPIKGYRNEIVYIWSITLPINIALNYLLIPLHGINGAALASSISFFLVCLLVFLLVRKIKNSELHLDREII